MTKAEAWLQCSAMGTTVTRLAYIGGFHPSCLIDRSIAREETPERWFILPLCNFISHLKLSPLYHRTARGAACTCHLVLYTD